MQWAGRIKWQVVRFPNKRGRESQRTTRQMVLFFGSGVRFGTATWWRTGGAMVLA